MLDFKDAVQIAASGMSAQRLRLNLISSNLANANTTKTESGLPYQRRDAIFRASSITSFDQMLSEVEEYHAQGVNVERVATSDKFREVFDPHNPEANSQGYVRLPDVNVVEEMVDMLQATRSYEANVQAIKALKSMAAQALSIVS
jgi:flagellar basal-body rod protein FlgC